ncbi:MAG: HAMP domain-containing protein, partial [Nocardioidaceae bacterium]
MRRLLILYGATLTSAVLVALLLPLGVLAQSLAHDRAVEAARQEAQGLAVVANRASTSQLRDAVDALNGGPRQTTVFLPDGMSFGPSTQRTPSVELAAQGRAFTAATQGGAEVLLPVGGTDGVTVIRTFVPDVLLREGVRTAWLTLAGTGALLLLAAVLVGGWIASRLSRSVRDLARVADRVGAGDLTATVTPAGPPEVAAVGRVLNGLGVRITQMLADERELGGDLSHRLRTPVTALRLDVETLQDPVERDRMTEHVDDLVAAIDAAVTAARHPTHVRRPGSCDAAAVVRERSMFWRVLADETHRPLT